MGTTTKKIDKAKPLSLVYFLMPKNPKAAAISRYLAAIGRKGGRVSSPAKAKASRRNARKGGRPMKFKVGDQVNVNDKAPSDYAGRTGTIGGVGPGRSEYRVEFTDGGHAYGYLMSWWLDQA
jgi:hypothetical protein